MSTLQFYLEDEKVTLSVKSKEVLSMAHWIIKEFG